MRARTTDDLLTDVRARTASPATNGLLSSTELLHLIDEEMRTELARDIVALRSEYWLEEDTQPIVAGTSEYRIPDRALGMTLRDVTIYDVNGNEWNVVQVSAADRYVYSGATGTASAFTLDNGKVVLLPEPSASGYTLRLRYYARPGKLVPLASSAPAFSATSTTIATEDPPYTPLQSAGTVFDVIRGDGMHEAIASGLVVSSYDAGTETITFAPAMTAAQASAVSAGFATYGGIVSRLCLAGETVYPPIPESMWGVLVALGCKALCEAVGDDRGLNAASISYERKRKAALEVMLPRVDGETRRVIAKHTPLRGAPRRSFGWGR